MNDQFLTELQNVMGGSGIFMEEPMKKHTTFRVGGPADVLVQPDETALVAILALCRQYHVSYSFIGNGSNLLVGDKGIRGVVIEMTDPMGNIEVDGTKITAQAGAMRSTWVTGIAVFQRKNILLQKLFWNLCRAMRRKSVPK